MRQDLKERISLGQEAVDIRGDIIAKSSNAVLISPRWNGWTTAEGFG